MFKSKPIAAKHQKIILDTCLTHKGLDILELYFLQSRNKSRIEELEHKIKAADENLLFVGFREQQLQQQQELRGAIFSALLKFFEGEQYFTDNVRYVCTMTGFELECFYRSMLGL